jgi:hypothetical protein
MRQCSLGPLEYRFARIPLSSLCGTVSQAADRVSPYIGRLTTALLRSRPQEVK